jgi:hypothetical protein
MTAAGKVVPEEMKAPADFFVDFDAHLLAPFLFE